MRTLCLLFVLAGALVCGDGLLALSPLVIIIGLLLVIISLLLARLVKPIAPSAPRIGKEIESTPRQYTAPHWPNPEP